MLWKSKPSLSIDENEQLLWEIYAKSQPLSCQLLLEAFFDLSCIHILETRSDVVAVLPSVIMEGDKIVGILRVVVEAMGYIPVNEPQMPTEICVNGQSIAILVEEGYYIPFAQLNARSSQNGIGCLNSYGG